MTKIPGKGATLNLQINSTFEPIAHGIDITPWNGSNQAINTTILTSTAQRKEGTAIPDYGDCQITAFLDPTSTTQNQVASQFSLGASTNQWKVNFADGDTSAATFAGPVTGYAPTGVVQDQFVQVQYTIAIDGAVTFTT